MKNSATGASLLEIVLILTVLAIMATMFVPLASGLVDVQRANGQTDQLKAIYTAIVGDRSMNTFGYLGDVGAYPSSLMDLVQLPASNPAGWNGPYLTDARIDNSVVYDQFGGPIEYFQPALPSPPTVATDQVGLISRGPDRSSTYGGGANANQSGNFNGTLPSASGYATSVSNIDNIVYPAFMDNTSLVNYQSLGTVNFSINNFDENSTVTQTATVNGLMPGCPGLFDIVVSSLTHPTAAHPNEAYMMYAPGGASVDLLQGTYLVQVRISGLNSLLNVSPYDVWQEQISVEPGKTVSSYIQIPGVFSSTSGGTALSKVTLSLTNNLAVNIQPMEYGANLGGAINHPNGSATPSAHRCSRINIKDSTTGTRPILDSFIMPNFAYTKRYVSANLFYTLTVTNASVNTVAIYDDGILVGTVGMRGNKRVKTFSIKSGDIVTARDDNNAVIGVAFPMNGNITKNY